MPLRAFIARYLVHPETERPIAYVPVHQLQRDPKGTMKEVLRFLFSDSETKEVDTVDKIAVNYAFDFKRRHHVKRHALPHEPEICRSKILPFLELTYATK